MYHFLHTYIERVQPRPYQPISKVNKLGFGMRRELKRGSTAAWPSRKWHSYAFVVSRSACRATPIACLKTWKQDEPSQAKTYLQYEVHNASLEHGLLRQVLNLLPTPSRTIAILGLKGLPVAETTNVEPRRGSTILSEHVDAGIVNSHRVH